MINKKYLSYAGSILTLALLCVFLIFSPEASYSAKKGITLCAGVVAPTLFPIFVINGLLVSTGTAHRLSKAFSYPIRKLFGINEIGVYPALMGLICGAPSGCIALSSTLEDNSVTRNEASVIAVLSSPISFSFLYATVGIKMLGSVKLGVLLYFINVLSSIAAGRILQAATAEKMKDHRHAPSLFKQKYHSSFQLSQAITDAVSKIVSICGAIVFFSSLSGIISSISAIPFPIRALTSLFLEITSGAKLISDGMPVNTAFLYLCAGCGWSGASIICQCVSSVGKRISLRLFLIGKCLCSLFCLIIGTLVNALGMI